MDGALIKISASGLGAFSGPSGVMFMDGTNVIPETNGLQDLGSTGSHWRSIYVDNIVSTGISVTGVFVHVTGDTMTGNLGMNNDLAIIMAPANVGSGNTVSNPVSTAFSSVFGYGNSVYANGSTSVAIGTDNTTSGATTLAVGVSNQSIGNGSSAFGTNNIVSGNSSVAFGNANYSNGNSSSAFGFENQANSLYSSAFGYENSANGNGTQVFGYQVTGTLPYTLYLGAPSGVMIQTDIPLLPESSGIQDIGSSNLPFNSGYFNNIIMLSSGNIQWKIRVTDDGILETYQ